MIQLIRIARYLLAFAFVMSLTTQARSEEREPLHLLTPELMLHREAIEALGFTDPRTSPQLSNIEKLQLQKLAVDLDPKGIVPKKLLNMALSYYQSNFNKIRNHDVLTVADFSQHSSNARLYLVRTNGAGVQSYHVAHGKNSDPQNTGYATLFSNQNGSEKTSLGFYLTAETYSGAHGYSLRLDGLSTSNSNARLRDIVVHGADYVHDEAVKAGRSWGCLAVPPRDRDQVVDEIRDGSLIFAAGSADL